ncbi:hypothetical protein HYW75_02940 [Candidatus Pacearchaeota archaeon]|nr:hypothetical protein [Candidatus Pacearchaeota archaeon]
MVIIKTNNKYKKERSKKLIRFEVILQIALLIGVTFAFSFMINEAFKSQNIDYQIIKKEEKRIESNKVLLNALKFIRSFIFNEKGLVSALENSDLQQGAQTCLKTKDNKICQSFPASECEEKCDGKCLPTTIDKVAQCKVGTCYNTNEGICSVGAPRAKCEEGGGKWFDDPYGNVQQCKQGCCVLGEGAYFGTEKQCEKDSSALGLKKDFRPEITTEIGCLALAKTQEEGACVFEQEFENTCRFTTKTNCLQNYKGKFYSGLLCSNKELKTNCKQQATAKCAEGKDEIYWFDSCGNRENIYDSNKLKSYNGGKVLGKDESCSLGTDKNLLANQKSCGNCDYLLGSKCEKKTTSEKLSDSAFDFVCKDLSCIDSEGKKKAHGESWCAYQGSIGTDKGADSLLRSTDIAGSRQFRKVCIDGSINTEPCADFRNEICVEAKTPLPGGGTFSSAACRINRWQQCIEYNSEVKSKDKSLRAGEEKKRDDKCTKNPDCFVKEVNINRKGFKFNICAPKYPPGFDLTSSDSGFGGEAICSLATQKCTVIYVKGLGGWDCKANCNCAKPKFAEQMNDLCISLGDCGTKVNIVGDLTKNHFVFKSKKKDNLGKEIGEKGDLSAGYISGLKKYINVVSGKVADPGNLSEFYGELGIPGGLGLAKTPADKTAAVIKMASMTSGMAGILIMGAVKLGIAIPGLTFAAGSTLYTIPVTTTTATGTTTVTSGSVGAAGPGITGLGGAVAGAAVGLAVVSLLLSFTGVGRGLPPAVTYSLMAVGAVAGAIIGSQVIGTGTGSIAAALAPLLTVAIIAIIVVIVVIIIFAALGIGKIKKVYYTFQCQPWQAPTGGVKCQQCGKDGLPCSPYACHSLGQTCEFLNEGTGEEQCVDIGKDDAASPVIKVMKNILPQEYSLEESELGIKIKSQSNDGCIAESYQLIPFGIEINEPAQCKISEESGKSFDEMEANFGGRNLYLRNHTNPLIIPSLESLGLESFDPRAKSDFNIYVRCQDKNGNKNDKDFVINFCVKQGNDTTPAIIAAREPYSEFVSFNATQLDASVFTNEPAECSWDSKDLDYSSMKNNFSCENEFEDRQLLGWQCNTIFPITENEHKYYIRCLDQPWLEGENATRRNSNKQSYEFKIFRSKSNLQIDSISVDNKSFAFGTELGTVDIVVKTSGGVDGTARCFYSWNGLSGIEFGEGSWTSSHRQVFNAILPGDYDFPVRCEDTSGNIAEKTAKFKVKFDNEPPKVTRVYDQSGQLAVITNEKAKCFFSFNQAEQCSFDIKNATEMSGSDLLHNTELKKGDKYYIKCNDEFNNYPGTCSIIVKGGSYDTKAQEL